MHGRRRRRRRRENKSDARANGSRKRTRVMARETHEADSRRSCSRNRLHAHERTHAHQSMQMSDKRGSLFSLIFLSLTHQTLSCVRFARSLVFRLTPALHTSRPRTLMHACTLAAKDSIHCNEKSPPSDIGLLCTLLVANGILTKTLYFIPLWDL